ncbi:MAG: TorF family putative porin, partial [Gammaproteobacteria bacterium]
MKLPANLWKLTGLMILTTLTGTSTMAFAAEKSGATVTGNIAATSTYVWRGLPQTAEAALQGGIDYSTSEGLHIGAWTSNVAAGSELDVTVGFAGA